jgi:hypothetical protein
MSETPPDPLVDKPLRHDGSPPDAGSGDSSPDPAFVHISPNPYIVGNPVRDRTMFFGREAEFELVRRRFRDSTRGGLLVFCGERRSGKTSILFQILDKRLGLEFIPVLIDMQSMAIANEADFLRKIAQEILDALGPGSERIAPPDFAPGSNHAATLQKFIEAVLQEHPHRKLILLFDEYELFENKIDSGVLGSDVLHILSHLMQDHSVFLVFTGSQHLEQRRRDYWRILAQSIWKRISYLDRSDAVNLIRKPVEGRVDFAEGTVEAIYRLTAGQPFYSQAVCQNLVDHLNEKKTRMVTLDVLGEVVVGLVNNPLPQMIFLWDSLERDAKLVLALLAEALSEERSYVGAAALSKLVRKREYPLDMSPGRIATALESLFRDELLSKDDTMQPPGYAFRMDLWRLWIRRMHSVWQVMREIGLDIRKRTLRLGRLQLTTALAAAGFVVAVWIAWMRGRHGPPPIPAAVATRPSGPLAAFTLEADPAEAQIHMDGTPIATGAYRDSITADQDHAFRLTAPGYADTTLSVRVVAGASDRRQVALRPYLGGLRIETSPPGAQIAIDGAPRGASPITVGGLPVAKPHLVEATLPGRATAKQSLQVEDGKVTPVSLTLVIAKTDLTLTSDPPGAHYSLDGVPAGTSPLHVAGVLLGRHNFSVHLEGFSPADSTVDVADATRQVHITLVPEPPGVLVVQGDNPAQILVDGALVAENVQNSGPLELRRGSHQVRVVLVSGLVIDKSLEIGSRDKLVYDYTKGSVNKSR